MWTSTYMANVNLYWVYHTACMYDIKITLPVLTHICLYYGRQSAWASYLLRDCNWIKNSKERRKEVRKKEPVFLVWRQKSRFQSAGEWGAPSRQAYACGTIFLVFKYLLYPFRKEALSFCLLQKAKLNDFLKTNAVTFANLPALLCLISLVCLIFSDYLN